MKLGLLAAGAAVAALMVGGAAQARVFDFSYSGPGVSGEGQFITTPDGADYLITDVTGVANGEAITGTSGYASADNLLSFPTEPFVDFSGIAFSTATKDWSIGYTGTAYGIVDSISDPSGDCCGITPLAFTVGVPEPATWAMMLVGFGGLGVAMRSRRRQFAAAA